MQNSGSDGFQVWIVWISKYWGFSAISNKSVSICYIVQLQGIFCDENDDDEHGDYGDKDGDHNTDTC